MTHQQNTVIWLGLILVVLNLIINLGEIKNILFGGAQNTTPVANPTPEKIIPQGLCPPGYTQVGGPDGQCVPLNQSSGLTGVTTPQNVQVALWLQKNHSHSQVMTL